MKSVAATATVLALVAALAAAPVFSAPPRPPSPSNVQITNVSVGATRASFTVSFTPARIDAKTIYPTYQFAVAPKFCREISAPSGKGGYPTQSYTTGPYQVSLSDCDCNKTYFARVWSLGSTGYTGNSVHADSPRVAMPCQK